MEEPEVIGDMDDLVDPETAPGEPAETEEPIELDQPIASYKPEEPLNNNNFNQVKMPSNKLPEWLQKNKTIIIAVAIGVIIGGLVLWKVLGAKK